MEGSCCYPKTARIRRRADFLRLQRTGRKTHTPSFVVVRSSGSGGQSARLGVTVSSRVGNSVTRNRVKRLIREVFRSVRRNLSPTTEVVVIAKPDAVRLTHRAVEAELVPVLSSDRRSSSWK